MLKVRQNMVNNEHKIIIMLNQITGASGEKTDLFHELEEKNRLE